MTARFEKAFKILMKFEGWDTVTDDKDDAGGLTKFGVSQKSYPDLDIKNLTIEDAKDIAFRDFWHLRLDRLKDEKLAIKLFVMGYLMGRKTAIILAQKALNLYLGENLEEDGIFGEKTLNALNRWYSQSVYSAIIFTMSKHLESLVKLRPKNSKYFIGWLNRLYA